MLLAFETPGFYEISMRGMQFDLDLLWLGPDKRIVGIALAGCRFPGPIPTGRAASYVLEIGAGEMRRLGLQIGDTLRF